MTGYIQVLIKRENKNCVFKYRAWVNAAATLCKHKGPFMYYVINEVGERGQEMEILDDLQYCKSSKSWVDGPKNVKNMMT